MNEFEIIEHYFKLPLINQKEVKLGIGDDAAVISLSQDKELVVSIDTLVEGVHFLKGLSPKDVANKSLLVNLSDIAAMGATPRWITLSLTLPENNSVWLEGFSKQFNKLLKNYKNTGYTKLALLSKANLDANINKSEEALKNFNTLIDLTSGYGRNKIFNKMGRVSAARILLSEDRYAEALKMIEVYSSSTTNGYIHELTGDILIKQNKNDLALVQYELAANKYSDETSKSIISMKIANIGS